MPIIQRYISKIRNSEFPEKINNIGESDSPASTSRVLTNFGGTETDTAKFALLTKLSGGKA
jgi:hypothetical protein